MIFTVVLTSFPMEVALAQTDGLVMSVHRARAVPAVVVAARVRTHDRDRGGCGRVV